MRKIYSFINGLEVLHLIGNLNLTFPHIKHFGSLTCLARNSGYQLKLNTVFCFCFFPLQGTYEKISEEEEEIYEVINIHKMKSATPNLRVVNLYGINFVDDSHVEAFSSNCIQVG